MLVARRRALIRAVGYLTATLLLPGSVQFAVGNRRVGKVALGVFLTVVLSVVALGWLGSVRPDMIAHLATSAFFLGLVRILVIAGAVGWVFLLLDSWRLVRPLELAQRARLVMTLLVLALVAAVLLSGLRVFGMVGSQRDLVASMFAGRPAIGSVDGRYNVLVLGGDAGSDREGMRPDSLTVVSVDADTGRTAMVGIPRNLLEAPFPEGSPLNVEWPNGFDCGDECTINNLYTWASTHPEVLPEAEDPGLEATRQAAEGVTGLTIPFTAIVDMAGFTEIVDAIGGIDMNVGKRVPIGGGTGEIEGWIEPGVQRFDGFKALWFARGREGSSDYERMVRQKCVMSAVARQVDPATALRNFQQLAEASTSLLRTDIPVGDVPGLLAVADKARTQAIDSVSLVPPLVNPAWPEYGEIHQIVQRLLAGEPVVNASGSGEGDGGVGNSASSAEAALIGSLPAQEPADTGGNDSGDSAAGENNEKATKGKAEATAAPMICAPA